MTDLSIRPAFRSWPDFNRRLRDRLTNLTPEQLAIQPSPDRWPLWASLGHMACQRVFWLCDFAGEPGAAGTPFPNAGWNCPGDDDLEHVWSPLQLADALDATFAIIDHCLDTWTLESLDDVIDHSDWGDGRIHSRGFVLQRVFAHDIWHIAELNETLSRESLDPIDIWS